MGNNCYKLKPSDMSVKRYSQAIRMEDNLDLIYIFIKVDNKDNTWPEIRGGIPL